MENKKVWFITGASKGLGLALVRQLLSEGYRVAVTSRVLSSLVQAVGSDASADFLPLEVDLTSESSVAGAIKTAIDTFGRIDVVVNNAGYGVGGAVEELSRKEIMESFDVNVFATITVIQAVMPYLRKQGSGHIINIASIAGFAGAMGWSVYAAAKHAVIGLSDVLAQDLQPLGIHVTAVAPGAFRTDFLRPESLVLSEKKIADYQAVHDSHARYLSMDGRQIGDPVKAAKALIQIVSDPQPPVLLFLGSDAYNRAAAKINLLSEQLEKWKPITMSTQLADAK